GMVPALGDPEFLNSLDFLGTPLRIQQIVVMQVPPLSFDEYLRISGDGWMADFMGRQDSFRPLPMELFISLTSRFREFLCTGGMPEAAQKTASLGLRRMEAPASVRHVRDRLIRRWKEDMLQGFRPRDREVIAAAWEAVGSRLRQKNKLFALSDIRRGTAKARLSALHWLVALGMIRLIPCTGSDPAEPLFKACYAGTAPLCQPYGGWTNEEMLPTGLCGLLNGALAENWLSRAL
ncbi:MAG: hypothetical protein Q4F72_12960, partial [Desulfovibrionaceae bacterium]|nr:hypothetical protein [Desulfovibrionaceae bacterium]